MYFPSETLEKTCSELQFGDQHKQHVVICPSEELLCLCYKLFFRESSMHSCETFCTDMGCIKVKGTLNSMSLEVPLWSTGTFAGQQVAQQPSYHPHCGARVYEHPCLSTKIYTCSRLVPSITPPFHYWSILGLQKDGTLWQPSTECSLSLVRLCM